MKHVLSNCQLALQRYTWRHNEVLKIIYDVTKRQIDLINTGKRPQKVTQKRFVSFIRPGQKSYYKQKQTAKKDDNWDGTWEIAADLPEKERFFPIPTQKKPDIVVWCAERKIVHLVELTVPHEDNIDAAHVRKEDRYEQLLKECEDSNWVATHLSVEVGCRGFVGNRLRKWLTTIGLSPRQASISFKKIQETVEKASHCIWL